MAHMLGEEGTEPALVEAGPQTPLLDPRQVVLLGWGPEQAQPREREAIERLGLATIPSDDVHNDPEQAARRALQTLSDRGERVLVHFDVDAIDFTDTPLSENTGRNEGLPYAVAIEALQTLLHTPNLAGLTITELNPDHAEEGAGSIERLAQDVAAGLTRI